MGEPGLVLLTWLVGCGGLLGAVGGIMIADYFVLRRTQLRVEDLYRRDGEYEFLGGFNVVALVALAAAIAPLAPGFLASLGAASPPVFFVELYSWSWFVAFALAGTTYLTGMRLLRYLRGGQIWKAAPEERQS